MVSLLGQLLLMLSLAAAGLGAALGLGLGRLAPSSRRRLVQGAAVAFGATALGATVLLLAALARNDFDVRYVAKVSSLGTPLHLRLAALWAGLDGSLLFWVSLLGGAVLLFLLGPVARATREPSDEQQGLRTLGVLCAVGAGFLVLVVGPASPFTPVQTPPLDGRGPAPLLQNHWLMLVHPPALYLGTVATCFPFALAVAALASGRLTPQGRELLRRWTLVAWGLLTAGIILGAWWSYEVLGWGGYWAWDPVENASLLPWLSATALLHALKALERREEVAVWSLFLAVLTFLFTLLGTFITRSGLFQSVHAFTRSSIGPAFGAMAALACLAGGGLLVTRARRLGPWLPRLAPVSREGSLWAGSGVLLVLAVGVLLGTLAPLLVEVATRRRVGVAPAYFNQLGAPMALCTFFLLGVGPALPWGSVGGARLWRALRLPTGAALLLAGAAAALGLRSPYALGTVAMAAFAAARAIERGLGSVPSIALEPRRLGAALAHLGAAVALVGIAVSGSLSSSAQAELGPGEEVRLAGFRVRYEGLVVREEAHRQWVSAVLTVFEPDGKGIELSEHQGPRLTFYPRREQPIGSPAVRSGALRDLYVVLNGFDPESKRVGLGAWVFPLVSWIWGALPLMGLGVLLCLWPRRGAPAIEPGGARARGLVSGEARGRA